MDFHHKDQPDNLQVVKALVRAGVSENMILKAVAVPKYQIKKIQRELGIV